MKDSERCNATVYGDWDRHRYHRRGVVKGNDGRLYCKQHSPVLAEWKTKKFKAKSAVVNRISDIRDAERRALTELCTVDIDKLAFPLQQAVYSLLSSRDRLKEAEAALAAIEQDKP